jgi:hypothetical protein
VSLTPAFENRTYVSKFEAEFIKALARESGAQRVLFDEKTEGRNSRDSPLKVPVLVYIVAQETFLATYSIVVN